MEVICNFDDVSPTMSGTVPTISAVGRAGNGAVYTGAGGKIFYFNSVPVTPSDTRVFSAWVKPTTGDTNLAGITLATGTDINGYQFFVDNRNGGR